MTDSTYCRHCDVQIESCLQASESTGSERIRGYFKMLAGRWTRLARDLESQRACGPDCPLRKACHQTLATPPAADSATKISAVA